MLRLSLWDRLIADPRAEIVAQPTAQAVRELIQSVRRDLQDLLNTRVPHVNWPPELSQLRDSLVNYGLPSFTHVENARDYSTLADLIKETIERFEPRLRNVVVEPLSADDTSSRVLSFRIQAQLVVEPLDDRIAFTSTLEPVSGNFQVERAST
jgi:type VI secretion system protein ImpF